MKRILSTHLMALACIFTQAQGPNDSGTYYKSANGKTGKALKTALFGILSSGTTNIGYDGLWAAYEYTDKRDDGKIWDMYSNITNYEFGSSAINHSYNDEGQSVNREHSLPQSWFKEASPMKADIVHVFPADGYVNNRRGSYPFGETDGGVYQSANGFSKVGSCKTSGYTGTVFEPNDIYKGDIARIYFYMATRYENVIANWSGTTTSDSYKPFPDWQMTMLLRWSAADPVSQKELDRNEAIFQRQGNRNPFVDYPGLEQLIWGNSTDEAFVYDNYESPSTGGGTSGGGSGTGGGTGGGGSDPVVTPSEGENLYVRITSTSDLEVGTSYLIVCESKNVAMGAHDGKNRNNVSVSINSYQITTSVGETGKPYEFVLGGNASSGYTLYDPVGKKYLAITTNSNQLDQLDEATTNNALWSISFSQNNAVISSKAYTSRSIMQNSASNNNYFRTYSSGQSPVQLYKKQQTTDISRTYTYNITDNKPVMVHSVQGMLIKVANNYTDALDNLPKGIYIINGRKIVIR